MSSCYIPNNKENKHEMEMDKNKQKIIPNSLYGSVVPSFSKA